MVCLVNPVSPAPKVTRVTQLAMVPLVYQVCLVRRVTGVALAMCAVPEARVRRVNVATTVCPAHPVIAVYPAFVVIPDLMDHLVIKARPV